MAPMRHRRDFVRGVLGGGLAGVGVAAGAPAAVVADDAPAVPASEVEARLAIVLARYGERLDPAAREAIRGEIAAQIERGKRLRTFPLENGDGPVAVFQPYRAAADGQAPGGGASR